MQLDKFTDYGLRILVALAVKGPDRVPTSDIARIYALSDNHLAKVASALVRLGFVTSERGRAGGLTLARPAKDISIGAVVRGLRSDTPIVECFGSDRSCRIIPACGLRGPLRGAQEAFYAALDGYTLADVTQSKSALSKLLALES